MGSADRQKNQGKARRRLFGLGTASLLVIAAFSLSSCYYVPYQEGTRTATAVEAPPPLTQLYFYPKMGQTQEQQSRDHYECYNWAVKQTGFDPGQSAIPKEERVRVVPMPPPGHDTATLAIAGAVLGALIGGPRHAGPGALIGATGGAILGAASDASRTETARQLEDSYARQDQARDAQLARKALDFRRAMSACMEGRGYSVR